MKKINLNGIGATKKIFHNQPLDVYPKKVRFEEINFWKDNLRTILPFYLIRKKFKKSLNKIPMDELVDFLAGRPELKIPELAKSIKNNWVKVPLVLLQDGTLLDGNRRYFACASLEKENRGKERPKALDNIPAIVIKNSDIDERIQQKILAEANFVDECKVKWPPEVKAQVIRKYFIECKKKGMNNNQIYDEIEDVYSLDKQDIDAYRETIDIGNEFIKTASSDEERDKFKEIVQEKFVFFWEFRNKAFKGRSALTNQGAVREVKEMFFFMIKNERFKNFKQVEPMIRSRQFSNLWSLLKKSGGLKIDQVEILYKENKSSIAFEDKIGNFIDWLDKNRKVPLTDRTDRLINKLMCMCKEILNR